MQAPFYKEAVALLEQLIATPSFSKEEDQTATLIGQFLTQMGVQQWQRDRNNIWAVTPHFDPSKPTLLLNSHHDTVKPNKGYTKPPFEPIVEDGKLYGLGSNDAGGCLVSLLATFLYFYRKSNLPINIVIAATAEEEISGQGGVEWIYPSLPKIDFAIVGEPTQTQLAIAEKGLLVLDGLAIGKAGHAAREEGVNALYLALDDIERLRNYQFEKISPWLGPVKVSVTGIETENKQHNVVPDQCRFIVDVRVTDAYEHETVLQTLQGLCKSTLTPRNVRLRSSSIPENHPLVLSGKSLGKTCYGSPTCSDQALIPVPSLKMGPGDSARSHTADEFIYLSEINDGILSYIALIEGAKF